VDIGVEFFSLSFSFVIGFGDAVHSMLRIFVILSGVIGRDETGKGSAQLDSMTGRKQRKKLSWDLRTFILLSIVMAVPANALMLLLPSEYSVDNYIGSTSVEMLFFATLLLLLVIPRVKDKSFKTMAILVAFGFLFQLIASGIWYYYGFVAEPRGIPRVNVGDLLHLGSYILWMGATVPYLGRYRRMMGGRSLSALMSYIALGTTVSFISLNYLYNSSDFLRYDTATIIIRLSYVLIPAVCLIVPLSTALIYIFDGYGRGLKKYYWMYSLVPICLIASSDLLRGTYSAIYETRMPFRFDEALALMGYATAISAALRLLRSQISTVTSIPLVLEGGAAKIQVELKSGKVYIVEDPKSDLGFEMFRQLINADGADRRQRGYIISRIDPIEIHQKYGLKDMRFTLLDSNAVEKTEDQSLLISIAQSIREYLAETKNGVVLIDGVNLLIAEIGFKKVNTLLEQISDFTSQYHSYIIMPIDAKNLSEKETAKIERIFETIRIGGLAALG